MVGRDHARFTWDTVIDMVLADEEAIQTSNSESKVFEDDDPDYATQGPDTVNVPERSTSHDESISGIEDSSNESSEEEAPPTQSNRLSNKGSFWTADTSTKGRVKAHNILRRCPGPVQG